MSNHLPTSADVLSAAERMRGRIVDTPVLESDEINRRAGIRVLLKAECLQHSGSFKIRGAMNKLASLGDAARSGVTAGSAGIFGDDPVGASFIASHESVEVL